MGIANININRRAGGMYIPEEYRYERARGAKRVGALILRGGGGERKNKMPCGSCLQKKMKICANVIAFGHDYK